MAARSTWWSRKARTRAATRSWSPGRRFVTTGATRGDQVAVLSGVKPGDVVVSAGQIKLHNDAPVVVNNTVQPADNPHPVPTDR